jgi:hypothetical protein
MGTGGSGGCTTPAQCPMQECHDAACTSGMCVYTPAAGTCNSGVCGTLGGAKEGTCVECNDGGDCTSGVCANNVCQTATCSDAVKNHGETGVDCGGPCVPCPTVVLIAGGAQGLLAGTYNLTAWATSALTGTTSDDPAIAFLPTAGTGQAIGLLHGANDHLDYTLWDGTGWSAPKQVNTDLTRGQPTIVASGTKAHAVFWDPNFKYNYESFSGGSWSAAAQPVIPQNAAQPCGPNAGVLAPLGAEASLVFVNGSCSGTVNHLYNSDLSAGVWQMSKDVASNPSFAANLRPAVAAPAGTGPELVAVYVQQGTSQMWSSYRMNGAWSAPVQITNGLTNDPVSLAPMTGGGAVMAYRGTDMKLYYATFSGTTWSTPAAAVSPTNVIIGSTPAVAKGVGGAKAELVYVDLNGLLFHIRLNATTWSQPAQIGMGTGFSHVAIAAGP